MVVQTLRANRKTGERRLQTGDAANQHVACPAHGAPDGECDNRISALKLVTNLIKR